MFIFQRHAEIVRNLDGGGGAGSGDQGAASGGGQGGGTGSGQGAGGGDAAAALRASRQGGRSLIDEQGDGGAAQGQQQQQADGQQQGQAAPYYPEGLHESLRGKTDRETIDALSKALRSAPATPEDYKLELPEAAAKAMPDIDTDPAYAMAAQIAHKHGLDNTQFSGMVGELFLALTEAGVLEPPVDTEQMIRELEPKISDPLRRKAAVAQRLTSAENWIKGEVASGRFTKGEAEVLAAGMTIAAGTTLVEKLRQLTGGGNIQVDGGMPGRGVYSWADADRDMADDRYSTMSNKYDPAFRKAADERMARLPRRANGARG